MRLVFRAIAHQCGLLGCRVGEASNPAPVQTRQARRLEMLGRTQVEPSGPPQQWTPRDPQENR